MKIPEGMTEDEVVKIIDEVAYGVAHKYRFGYYTLDDIQQEARLKAIEAVDAFDPTKKCKLKTFLWTHVKNRLSNLKRDKYARPNTVSEGINDTKKNIMSPISLGCVRDENEDNMRLDNNVEDKLDYKYMVEMLDEEIPINMRSSWIKMKNDIKMPKAERAALLETIQIILAEKEYGP